MARVTAFVTTVGRSTFKRCLEHIAAQSEEHVLTVISGVSPMSAALQRMADECQTEYYVQVDEDMILYPHALTYMVEMMDHAPSHCVMCIAHLHDEELNVPIFGLKCYRTELIRQIPFEDHPEGDVHDRERWQAEGMCISKSTRSGRPVGLHGTHYTPRESFARWRRLWETHRMTGRLAWIEAWPVQLAARAQNGDRAALGGLLGSMVGMHGDLPTTGPDARRLDFQLEQAALAFDLSDVAVPNVTRTRT